MILDVFLYSALVYLVGTYLCRYRHTQRLLISLHKSQIQVHYAKQREIYFNPIIIVDVSNIIITICVEIVITLP